MRKSEGEHCETFLTQGLTGENRPCYSEGMKYELNALINDKSTGTAHLVACYEEELKEKVQIGAFSYRLPHPAFYRTRCTRQVLEENAREGSTAKRTCKTCVKKEAR